MLKEDRPTLRPCWLALRDVYVNWTTAVIAVVWSIVFGALDVLDIIEPRDAVQPISDALTIQLHRWQYFALAAAGLLVVVTVVGAMLALQRRDRQWDRFVRDLVPPPSRDRLISLMRDLEGCIGQAKGARDNIPQEAIASWRDAVTRRLKQELREDVWRAAIQEMNTELSRVEALGRSMDSKYRWPFERGVALADWLGRFLETLDVACLSDTLDTRARRD